MTTPSSAKAFYYERRNRRLTRFIESKINNDLARLKYEDLSSSSLDAVGIPAGSVRRRDVDTVAVGQLNTIKRLVQATALLSAAARHSILTETANSQQAWRDDADNPTNPVERHYFRKLIHVPDWMEVFCKEINATLMWVDDRLYYFDPARDDFADEIAENWTPDEITQKVLWVNASDTEEWSVRDSVWWDLRHRAVEGRAWCSDGCCYEEPTASYEPKIDRPTRMRRKANLIDQYK